MYWRIQQLFPFTAVQYLFRYVTQIPFSFFFFPPPFEQLRIQNISNYSRYSYYFIILKQLIYHEMQKRKGTAIFLCQTTCQKQGLLDTFTLVNPLQLYVPLQLRTVNLGKCVAKMGTLTTQGHGKEILTWKSIKLKGFSCRLVKPLMFSTAGLLVLAIQGMCSPGHNFFVLKFCIAFFAVPLLEVKFAWTKWPRKGLLHTRKLPSLPWKI